MKNEKQQKLELVLERIRAACEADSKVRQMYQYALEYMLTDLRDEDAFGTEGQSDPRGDFRNGHWSMSKVEGFKHE